MRVVPDVFGPRAARAKSICPVTLTVALVHESDRFSHPVPLIASSRAPIPAVVEFGRSKDGPPTLVVMQPGLRVVPPLGSGVEGLDGLVVVGRRRVDRRVEGRVVGRRGGRRTRKASYRSWVTSAPTPTKAVEETGSAWA